MAVTKVRSANKTVSTASDSIALGAQPAVGDLLVIEFECARPSQILTPTNVTGVTWTESKRSSTNVIVQQWWAVVGAGIAVSSFPVAMADVVASGIAQMHQYHATLGFPANPVDASAAANTGTSTSPTSATITPTAGRNAVIVFNAKKAGAFSSGPTNGFTDESPSGGFIVATLIVAGTTGSYSTAETYSTSSAWDTAIVAYLETAAVPQGIVTTQPSTTVSGVAISPSVVWKATTDGSTIDTTFNGNVTVSSGSGTATLSGTLTVAAINGVATFSNIIPTGATGSNTLHFVGAGYANVDSNSYTVNGPAAVMGVQPPSTMTSGLGLYKFGTGSGTVAIAGGAGACTFSTSQAGVLDIGSYLRIGAANMRLSAFNGTTGGTLVKGDGSAAADVSASAFTYGGPVAVRVTIDGSTLDTSFNGNIVASKASGSGTLTGTLTVAAIGGVAIFGDLGYTGTGAFTVLFTASGYSTITSSSCTASAPYASVGVNLPGCFKEPTLGIVIPYHFCVYAGATAGVPMSLLTSGGGAGTAGADNVQNTAWGMGNEVNNNISTFPFSVLFPQMPWIGDGSQTKLPWCKALPLIHAQLIAAGFNLDLGKMDLYGYSMTATEIYDCLVLQPTYWRSGTITDAGMYATHMLDATGAAGPSGPLVGKVAQATDTAVMQELVRLVGDTTAIFFNQGDTLKPNVYDTAAIDAATIATGTFSLAAGAGTFSVSQAGLVSDGCIVQDRVAGGLYIVSAFNGTTGCTLTPTSGSGSSVTTHAFQVIPPVTPDNSSPTLLLNEFRAAGFPCWDINIGDPIPAGARRVRTRWLGASFTHSGMDSPPTVQATATEWYKWYLALPRNGGVYRGPNLARRRAA